MSEPRDRAVPAPELVEVAQIWWDTERVPQVRWSDDATVFELVDPAEETHRLELLRLAGPPPDAWVVADVLANGLAACDFPPTGDRASPPRVDATLKAAGIDLPASRHDR